jgi:NitT/TauT family transport system permease protein
MQPVSSMNAQAAGGVPAAAAAGAGGVVTTTSADGSVSAARRRASLLALRRVVLPVLAAALVLAVWEGGTRWAQVPEVLLPPPSAVFDRLVNAFPLLMMHAWPTIWQSLAGFAIATLLGITLATLLSASTLIRETLYPNVVFFQLIPKIALAPLFVVWFGLGPEARLSFSVFVSFFPVVIATLAGLDNVERDLLRLCRALTASNWQTFVSVRLPHAMPYIFSGMKIASTFAIIGVIVGEFITSRAGLGYLILFASAQAETALILAAISVLCVFGLVFYGVVALCERWTIERFGDRPR